MPGPGTGFRVEGVGHYRLAWDKKGLAWDKEGLVRDNEWSCPFLETSVGEGNGIRHGVIRW